MTAKCSSNAHIHVLRLSYVSPPHVKDVIYMKRDEELVEKGTIDAEI